MEMNARIRERRSEQRQKDEEVVREYQEMIQEHACMVQGYRRAYHCYLISSSLVREKFEQEIKIAERTIEALQQDIQRKEQNKRVSTDHK